MNQESIDITHAKNIYFVGIGGISMSSLALMLLEKGYHVAGSDRDESEQTRQLGDLGVSVYIGQKRENIASAIDTLGSIDMAILTAAIHPDNPEYAELVARGIPMATRAQLVGAIMKMFRHSVGVSGTHGKTTTTSMLSSILLAAGLDPTISIGGILPSIGGTTHIGTGETFVTEACEYTNSFLSFFPTIEIILNVEADHLDFFKDLDDIRHSFRKFASLLPSDGLLVINSQIEDIGYIIEATKARVVTFSLEDVTTIAETADDTESCRHELDTHSDTHYDTHTANDTMRAISCDKVGMTKYHTHYFATDITYDDLAHPTFTIIKCTSSADSRTSDGAKDHTVLGQVSLHVPGRYNIENAMAAIATADCMGVTFADIKKGLDEFTGAKRRFETKGTYHGATIIDDYAHHPQEIEAALRAARAMKKGRLYCVFQPHTYTRTHALLPEFAKALEIADIVVLADIYAAREVNTLGISSSDIADIIIADGGVAHYLGDFGEIHKFLSVHIAPDDMCITMGAGDVYKIGDMLLSE